MSQRFRYIRNDKGMPLACIATSVEKDARLSPTNIQTVVSYALSILNPKDRFDRKLARRIAIGRLEKCMAVVLPIEKINCHHINLTVMRHISERQDIPKRVRKAAEEWLVNAIVKTAMTSKDMFPLLPVEFDLIEMDSF